MELKYMSIIAKKIRSHSLNRTFMELKYLAKEDDRKRVRRLNRTFMELKSVSILITLLGSCVLIEPSWN